jgi:peptidoglycan/xylan/chitin deacetylase (PgdA/CDA1 family)
MSLYFNHSGWLFSQFFKGAEWRLKSGKDEAKTIYLTFDDGPVPTATPFVLELLKKYDIKATFFCVGDNIKKYPELYKRILQEGHRTANHTYNHLKGWKHADDYYFANIMACEAMMEKLEEDMDLPQAWKTERLFRPPYGKMKTAQCDYLQTIYRIIMWDVITGDFDKLRGAEKCLQTAIKDSRDGSIVIFHDSMKALENLDYALPKYIESSLRNGYQFKTL